MSRKRMVLRSIQTGVRLIFEKGCGHVPRWRKRSMRWFRRNSASINLFIRKVER